MPRLLQPVFPVRLGLDFEFVGPAAYGEQIVTRLELIEITNSTLTWKCTANRRADEALVTEGTATRVYAEIQEDGELKAIRIPDKIRALLGAPSEHGASHPT